jgi:uncharacterized protein
MPLRRITCHLRRRALHLYSVPSAGLLSHRHSRGWPETKLICLTQRRNLLLSGLPTAIIPPVVFVGLVITLWTYKCIMMVLFQNKIIYMPSMPPFSRSEKIADYERQCMPVIWERKVIHSLDGTNISLAIGNLPAPSVDGKKQVILLYFQG